MAAPGPPQPKKSGYQIILVRDLERMSGRDVSTFKKRTAAPKHRACRGCDDGRRTERLQSVAEGTAQWNEAPQWKLVQCLAGASGADGGASVERHRWQCDHLGRYSPTHLHATQHEIAGPTELGWRRWRRQAWSAR